MDNFFPQEYQLPKSASGYMRLEDGRNRFRVLSSAIVGYEYWNTFNKPVRSPIAFEYVPEDIRLEKDGKPRIKHFWAFVVYNYAQKQIQILQLTQKSIMTDIKALVDDPSWGNPKNYDIAITRKGDGLDTEYSVMPNPHSRLPEEITKEYDSKNIDLNKMFQGEDPFNTPKRTSSSEDYPEGIDVENHPLVEEKDLNNLE